MPTNILRSAQAKPRPAGNAELSKSLREILITSGRIAIRARLLDTPTADRLWAALPLHSTAERWGDSLHFEVPIESGRERSARQLGAIGEIYYWIDDDRIFIPFGRTPISRPGEIRLPKPCNLLASTSDDVSGLKAVTPGEKVSVRRVEGT
jgi:hypothetical protein